MANASLVSMQLPSSAHCAQWKLVDGIATTTACDWQEIGEYRRDGLLEVLGIATTTAFCELRGANGSTIPATATAGVIFGNTITANGFYVVSNAPRYLKIDWTGTVNGGAGTGTANAYYIGSR